MYRDLANRSRFSEQEQQSPPANSAGFRVRRAGNAGRAKTKE
jgi:hypothetical protein